MELAGVLAYSQLHPEALYIALFLPILQENAKIPFVANSLLKRA